MSTGPDAMTRAALETLDRDPHGFFIVVDGDRLREAWASAGEVSVADHTANLVPHFAAGPGAEALRGIHTPASLGRQLMTAVGGEELPGELPAGAGTDAGGEAGPR